MAYLMVKDSYFTLMARIILDILIREMQIIREDLLALRDGFIRESYRISRQREKAYCIIKDWGISFKEFGQEICLMVMAENSGKQKMLHIKDSS